MSPTAVALLLLSVIALGLALRLIRIGYNSYWTDEVISVLWIRNSFRFLWTTGLLTDPTPPLYYTLLKAWTLLTGSEAEAPVRLLSALISTATIPLVFLLGREFLPARGALLAALLFALDPIQIFYSQEARSYTLLPLFLSLSLLGLVRYARHRTDRMGQLWLYVAGGILLLYTHATAIVTLASLSAGLVIHVLHGEGRRAPDWRQACIRLGLANLLVLAAGAPRLWLTMHQHAGTTWIERPRPVPVLTAFASFLIDPESPQVLFRVSCLLMTVLCALAAVALVRARPGALVRDFLVAPPLLFLATALLVSFFRPFFIPRVTIWIPVPLCLLAAIALEMLPPDRFGRLLAILLPACIIGTLGLGWHGVYIRQAHLKEDWRGLTRTLSGHSKPADEFVVGPTTNPLPLNLYGMLRDRRAYATATIPVLRWAPCIVNAMLWLPAQIPEPRRIDSAMLARDMRGDRRVWIVLNQRDWHQFGRLIVALLPAASLQRLLDRHHPGLVLIGNEATLHAG